jgi:hypothetical protein
MTANKLWLALGLCLAACDGQQYVSPDTVALVIVNDDTGVTRVNRCNYIPVLLGSQVKWRYVIEDELKATITITRSAVDVTFEGDDGEASSFHVATKELDSDSTHYADSPPEGYTVSLQGGCTPDDDEE